MFDVIHDTDRILTTDLESVSDKRLSELFQDCSMRKYIAPSGILNLQMNPLKPLDSNIPVLRGLEGSTQIYSDVEINKNELHGLLSVSTKYATRKGESASYVIYLDILGDDPSSLRKHFMRHLMDMTKSSKDAFALNITLPDGIEFEEIGRIFTEYNVEIDESRLATSACSRFHLIDWWKEEEHTV